MPTRFATPAAVLAGAALVALAPGTRADDPKEPAADRVKVVRAAYEKVPPTVLGIKEPVRVEQCMLQKVPVSHNLMLVDADDAYHYFDWWLDRGKFQNAEFDRVYWTYHKGVAGERKGKFRLAVRGPEEDAMYGVRRDGLDDRGPSVIALNGTLVSLAVIEFMVYITGVPRPPKRLLRYDGFRGIVNEPRDPPRPACPYCTRTGDRDAVDWQRHIRASLGRWVR